MVRKTIAILVFVASAAVAGASAAQAAPNPAGTGQPSAECGDPGATSMPHGFTTDGFANAESHYAGSEDTPSLNAHSDHAVSQYDVACYQHTNRGP